MWLVCSRKFPHSGNLKVKNKLVPLWAFSLKQERLGAEVGLPPILGGGGCQWSLAVVFNAGPAARSPRFGERLPVPDQELQSLGILEIAAANDDEVND